ncbi:MgtC/SapB family protein [Clostridioides mangenotii]|uniref:MgtC/SapB family protein n=1 Tax=Metaclostridioides mangenotii TaxID=1540 RepID=UPI001C1276B6|nr:MULTISPECIES: MgtC/SapB family protein [Clostridioides]MBS5787284.1 MgtC/SapB family protein [Clostridioides difficile]MBU5307112.1 MgtC/SapB family protein [Clostridioides mangenotii]MCR1953880.1 MgtC/SapB family protein [Clostridioides mangenotii]
MNSWEIATRLVLALVLGGLIGLEREKIHQYAGFRTHILIALGACISAMVSLELVSNYNSADPSRIPGQVLTGIGFLGAGAILKTKVGVKGLTTAAGMWATACLGIAIGCGYYMLSILGWLSIVITLFLLRVGSELLFKNEKNIIRIKVEDIKLLSLICNKLEEERVMVKNINVEYCDSESWELILTVLHDRRIVFGIVANEIKNLEGIISIKCSE